MTRRQTIRSARYGQACLSCARAKSRCIVRPDGTGCERCQRLIKECQPPEPVTRRRLASHKQESQERIAGLEGRLQGLVSLLQSRHIISGQTSGSQDSHSHEGNPAGQTHYISSTPTSPSLTLDTTLINDVDAHVGVQIDSNVDMNATPVPASIARVSEQLDLCSASSLDTFRSCALPYFPFIRLAPNITAEELHHRRPLLLKAMVCVAWPTAREKPARARELKWALCEAAFLGPQKDAQPTDMDSMVDLLLALMTYIAWGWDHVYNRASLSRLMMLCVSLVGEMSLDRSPPKEPHVGNLLIPRGQRQSNEVGELLCIDKKRALLGCFVLSSTISRYFADADPMRWTPQLEEALATVSGNNGSPTDADLVLQVRLELLSTKADQLRDLLQRHPGPAQSPISAEKVFSDAESLLSQLRGLRRMPSWSSGNHQQIHLAHTYYVELIILEIIRVATAIISRMNASMDPRPFPVDVNNNGSEHRPALGYSDLSYMWQSVLAINACTSGLLSLSSDFVGISFLQWEHLAGCIITLSHLEAIEDPRINRAHARAVVDLPVLLNRVAKKLSQTAIDAHEEESGGLFTQLAAGVRTFRSSIQSSLVEAAQPRPNQTSGCYDSNSASHQQGYFINHKFWMEQFFID